MDVIPPTRGALIRLYAKVGITGGRHSKFLLIFPLDWGWTDSNNWKPLWITLPEASISSRELIHCICKTGYKGQCKCKREAIELLLLFFFKL